MTMPRAPSAAKAAPLSGASPAFSFRSDAFAPHEALSAWREQFGALNDIVPAPNVPFSAQVDYWRVGQFAIANTRASPMRLVRQARRARSDGFEHWVLRVSRHGEERSRSRDSVYVSRPGDLVVERLTEPYEDHWVADEWVAAIFAPGVFPMLDRTLAALPPGPVPGARAALLAQHLLQLDRRLPWMGGPDLAAVAEATEALIASLASTAGTTREGAARAARLRAEQVIRANLASARLDSRRIAALSGVSRATLYRLFDDCGGVAAHVRRLRLDAVHAALRDPVRGGETIAEIGERAGLHCAASFSRAFKAHFGVAPGQVRAGEGAEARAAIASGGDYLDLLFPAPSSPGLGAAPA